VAAGADDAMPMMVSWAVLIAFGSSLVSPDGVSPATVVAD
jgi:hypothetical protein